MTPRATASTSRRPGRVVCLALAALAVAACRVDEGHPASADGPRLEIRETYGEDGARGVDLTMTLIEESPSILGLADVQIRLRPDEGVSVRKLEAILQEAGLRIRPDGADWPTRARSVPEQASPALTRVQLALALLDLEGVGFDHPTVRLFDDSPTIGLTRVRSSEHGVRVHVLSLAVKDGVTAVAWASASGSRDGARVDLDGRRHILGEEPEAVQVMIRRDPPTQQPSPPTDG